MRLKKKLFSAASVAAIALGFAAPSMAQVPAVLTPGINFVGGFEANLSCPDLTSCDAFTVPAGQNVILTDVIISPASGNTVKSCCARIARGSGCSEFRTNFINVPPDAPVSIQFNTGMGFTAGQVICVRNGASSGDLHFTLRGYRFTF